MATRLPLGEPGEICIKGPNVMRGYYNQPAENEKAFTADGFMRTGDIGIMDERGYTKIVDRKKDMILVSGFNVFPNELENVISLCPGVVECAAIGVPDEKQGEAIKVFVVKNDPTLSRRGRRASTAGRTSPATRCPSTSSSGTTCPRPTSARSCGASCGRPNSERTRFG